MASKGSGQVLSVTVPTIDGPTKEHLITPKVADQLAELVEGFNDSAEIVWPATDDRVRVSDAREALRRASKLWVAEEEARNTAAPESKPRLATKELLLHDNELEAVYQEEFSALIADQSTYIPRLPEGLRPDIKLKDHQLIGIARMQALLDRAPRQCRGVVLADDMGLGKSVQLLTLLASHFESNASEQKPGLIVMPASLLQNWLDEIDRFFKPSTFHVLTLYGPALSERRESKDKIDRQIVEEGIKPRFLRPDWLGTHNLVLTTYETLRDLEFSLASTAWSVMICDEAQKIKNPDAFVTRSAKKQNADFRIACTGTPVENSLQDLWCLFDFIQPGLLGSRLDFTRSYRRPIECDTEDQRDKIAQLRTLIEPQIIRRTKLDVAKDLPPKVIDEPSLRIGISPMQRKLYAQIRQSALHRSPSNLKRRLTAWQILPRLREICSDPRETYERGLLPVLAKYREDSPKLQWLLKTLDIIKERGDKALVFCDLREIQRILAYAIFEQTGFTPDVINGDTEMSLDSATSRQSRIAKFQRTPGFGVIILSPLTVGFGVNIQAANHVIHFVRMWNPAKEDQATDRAYRIGQLKPVYVYYPTITADFLTFDMKLNEILERKRSLSGDMLNGASDVEASEFVDALEFSGDAFSRTLTYDDVSELTGVDFERLLAGLWSKRGYTTKITGKSGDRGVDIVAIAGTSGKLIQCKGSSLGKEINADGIKDVVFGAKFYGTKYPGVDFEKVCVTNQRFNARAQEDARLNAVALYDQDDLTKWLTETPIRVSELSVF